MRTPEYLFHTPAPHRQCNDIVAQSETLAELDQFAQAAKLLKVPIIIKSRNIGTDESEIIVYELSVDLLRSAVIDGLLYNKGGTVDK